MTRFAIHDVHTRKEPHDEDHQLVTLPRLHRMFGRLSTSDHDAGPGSDTARAVTTAPMSIAGPQGSLSQAVMIDDDEACSSGGGGD